ncbi:DUF2079 domain-containing protein [Acidimicrobiales bacterium]|nr:DUF2079 domain-containing protein [bacterium]MDC3300205.1 DUF2079 domain-containing protein [Acidimicrobiales bacterium]
MSAISTSLPAFERLRSVAERVWERIDRSMLRLQGRLDTPSYDRWLPYGFAIVQITVLITLVLARFHQLDHGVETAKYAQAAWQIGEDLKPVTTLAGGNLIAEQGSLILYPLGLLTSVLPRIETLLIIKSIALGLTIIPLWRLARRHGLLGIGATSTIVFAYSIYTYVHNMNVADFAPAVLAVPALMWAVLSGFDAKPDRTMQQNYDHQVRPRAKRIMTLAIIFALCCRADLGLAVAGLGVLLLIERRRRVGLIALLVGMCWFVVAMYGLQRGLSDGAFPFLEPYVEFGDTPLGVLWGILSHPVRFAQIVGTQANFQILVTLLAPVLFLPLTAPRYLMPAMPLYVLYMGADVPPGRLREAAQTVPMTVFVFVATVFALKRTGRILVKQVRVERRIILALLLTAIVFFVRDSSTTPYTEPWQWGGRDETDLARVDAIELIPIDEPVRASVSMLPLLAERLGVYELDFSIGEFGGEDPEIPVPLGDRLNDVIAEVTSDVDWLLVDRDLESVEGLEGQIDTFRVRLGELGWELQSKNPGLDRIEVYNFTGIIGAVPVAQEEPVDLFGFGQIDEVEVGDGAEGSQDADG